MAGEYTRREEPALAVVLFASDHCPDCRTVSEEGERISPLTAGLGLVIGFEME